jgi:alpha-galactosidase
MFCVLQRNYSGSYVPASQKYFSNPKEKYNMSNLIFRNDFIEVRAGIEKGLISIKSGIEELVFDSPSFEIDGKLVGGNSIEFSAVESERELLNGGKEFNLIYDIVDYPQIKLNVLLRCFPGSPFIRYKYKICSCEKAKLTKMSGKDNIFYTGIAASNIENLTEIQFSQYESIVHSFFPHFQERGTNELKEGISFPGPIAFIEGGNHCALLAYEHGAEYPDSYLDFNVVQSDDSTDIRIKAVKGNYYNGQTIDINNPFESVWFHFALSTGDRETLLKHYREFFLKYISENNESRKPYIFYNTWNNQERNRYYKNLPYLDSMHYDHIMKEIDIAHSMGVEVFVIDTGWYNKTGDWIVNSERFPDKLKNVKAKLDSYGMKLGLWFNPIVAAKSTQIYLEHPEYVMAKDGVENYWGKIWETEESYGMCLATDYTEHFIKKLVQLNKELGVTYFKWDAIGQYGCNCPNHQHGTVENSNQERLECYSYEMGRRMIKIVEEVSRQCPDIIVDFDVTEGGRFVGLGFLSVGKYFLMNNGPYFSDFDIPKSFRFEPNTINVFFHPGAARPRVCRQGLKYDSFVPSILFLTHFLPDGPRNSQMNSLCSLMLGSNGIWGDLISLSEEDVNLFKDILDKYKKIRESVTLSYPKVKGFIGASPEIYEKVQYEESQGLICLFTRAQGTFTHITDKINPKKFLTVEGADSWELTAEERLKITVQLKENEARPVFIFGT